MMFISNEELSNAFKFHGHRCPAMPLGLRAGLLALEKLGVARASNKELYAVMETGPSHPMMCFADGVQIATGCTYGKNNIVKLDYGKLAFTLIDRATGRSIRVAVKAEFFEKLYNSRFVQLRLTGVEPKDVPPEIADEAINMVLSASDEELFHIYQPSPVSYESKVASSSRWSVCKVCGEPFYHSGDETICPSCRLAHKE